MSSAEKGGISINWRENSGAAWVREEARVNRTLGPLGRAGIDALELSRGAAVLDVGCGSGQTLLELAERVGGEGSVLGLDVSQVMVERARQRANEANLPNVNVLLGDAATVPFAASRFDAIFSRFGVMFFEDTAAACVNLLSALKSKGRVAFVCWQALERNPWAFLPLRAVQEVLALESLPDFLQPERPGPFRFADPKPLVDALLAAQCRSVEVKGLDMRVPVGGAQTLDEAVDYAMHIGPASRLLADTEPALREAVAAAMRRELAPLHSENGVWSDASAWLFSASR